jgi:putative transcriptional regulator
MKKDGITNFKLDPKNPLKPDWRALDAMTEAERHAAALSDPDALPAREEQLQCARRAPDIKALRGEMSLTQEQFAARFGLPLGTVRDWEQGIRRPNEAARILLEVIASEPEAVARAVRRIARSQ